MVDDIQNSRLDQLCFHNGSDNFNHRLSGEHDASLRDSIDAAGKFEILQVFQESIFKDAEAFQIGKLIVIKVKIFHIFNDLLQAGTDGIAGFHRIVPVKSIKNNRFITIHVFEVALHHCQFIKIGHEGKIPRFHGCSSAFIIVQALHSRTACKAWIELLL